MAEFQKPIDMDAAMRRVAEKLKHQTPEEHMAIMVAAGLATQEEADQARERRKAKKRRKAN